MPTARAIRRLDRPQAKWRRSTSRIFRMDNLSAGIAVLSPRGQKVARLTRGCRSSSGDGVPQSAPPRRHHHRMGGRDRPESVVAFNWNAWSRSPGIGGRNRPENAIQPMGKPATWCSSWLRWRCHERCSPTSCAGSMGSDHSRRRSRHEDRELERSKVAFGKLASGESPLNRWRPFAVPEKATLFLALEWLRFATSKSVFRRTPLHATRFSARGDRSCQRQTRSAKHRHSSTLR